MKSLSGFTTLVVSVAMIASLSACSAEEQLQTETCEIIPSDVFSAPSIANRTTGTSTTALEYLLEDINEASSQVTDPGVTAGLESIQKHTRRLIEYLDASADAGSLDLEGLKQSKENSVFNLKGAVKELEQACGIE